MDTVACNQRFSRKGVIMSNNSQQEVTLLFSGGPDSTTLLFDLIDRGYLVHALTYNFGESEGAQERQHAEAVATVRSLLR